MNASNLRVALIVDNPLRDLPGLTMVALRLCRAGATCHLVPMNLQDTELRALAPDAVVVNYLRPGNEALVRQLLDARLSVFLLDTEGGVYDTYDSYGMLLAPDPTVRHGLAAWCSWGPGLAAYGTEQRWFRPSQVVVTGAPRFDFYAPAWRHAALAASPDADRIGQPMVLVCCSLALANPRFKSAADELRDFADEFGLSRAEVARWQEMEREAMVALTDLVNRLASRFPEVTFVYRPHPFESETPYRQMLDDRPNLHLTQEGTVDGWILRSAAVVQRSSTTGVEAALAGVPTLSPRWIPVVEEAETAEEVSIACFSADEMEQRLEQVLNGHPAGGQAEVLDKVLGGWFRSVDGRAHERVAEVVLARSELHDRVEHLARCRSIGGPVPTAAVPGRMRAAVKAGLKRRLSPTARARLLRTAPWDSGEKRFGPPDVRAITSALLQPQAGGTDPAVVDVDMASTDASYRSRLRHGRSVTLRAVEQ